MESNGIYPEICKATETDAARIWEIQRLAFYEQGILYDDLKLPPLIQTLEELIEDFKAHIFLKALYKGKIVGSVRGKVAGDTCFISRLIVHPDYQNRGIGKKLMQAIENRFMRVHRYELFTGHKSAKNLALYGKLGYREYKKHIQGNKVVLIYMEKRNTRSRHVSSG